MVVIEPEPEKEVAEKTSDAAKASASHSTVNGDSDGFETASEGDVDADADADDAAGDGSGGGGVDLNQHQEPREGNDAAVEQSTSPKDDSQIVAADDESNQIALAQANEAKLEGNKLFANSQYEEALLKYELALKVAPDIPASVEIRSICHGNRAICLLKMGKYEDTIKECNKALELNPTYMKALVRRSEAHEKLENYEEALADNKKILEMDPSNNQAKKAIVRLEPLAAEKREKMKEEMIAKLKDMGNSVLGRFGMSTDNFKAVKDPNTGSYSISFQR
ncbi:uncharacterized protein LOC115677418 [Syzygium oleosum]|uniref:uncharacterized protein LOC115677418 n=1 Tax=Syzygium oleosum TaxID=219896 RepID=UPI0024BA3B7A|nr:uncharacterized protein LOC115677418 [Syzygium oleosum]